MTGFGWMKFDPFRLHGSCSPSTCHESREATPMHAQWIELDLGYGCAHWAEVIISTCASH